MLPATIRHDKGTGRHACLSASFRLSSLSLALGDQKSFGSEAGAEGKLEFIRRTPQPFM